MKGIIPNIMIDCVGLYCPQPIFEIKKAISSVEIGEVIEMTADDPGSEPDIRAFVKTTGHELLLVEELEDGIKRFVIRREK